MESERISEHPDPCAQVGDGLGVPLCSSFHGAGMGFIESITWRLSISVHSRKAASVLAAPRQCSLLQGTRL